MLRALGPLIFLSITTIVNVALDIIFVLYVHLGVAGAAYATIIFQAISAIGLAFYVILLKKKYYHKKHYIFDQHIFKKIKDYSLMTCLQQEIMNFGILMIQGLVNSFGIAVMSAFSAAVKIDSFAYMPVQDFGNAFSTFVSQNKGANEEKRIQDGLKIASLMALVFCIFISLGVCIFSKELMMLFVSKMNIIKIGMTYLRVEGSFYIGIGCLFLLYGYYRGVGKMKMSLILTIVSLGTRVLLACLLAPSFGVEMIWWAIVIGWILADTIGIVYGIKIEKWFK